MEQNEKIYFAEPNAIIEIEEPISIQDMASTMSRSVAYSSESRYWDYTTNDPRLGYQQGIYLHNIDKVWNAFTIGSSDVVVGVIDSGIYNHRDLSANLLPSYNCVEGYAESHIDICGHGTEVASIIGAKGNNNIGMVGVCQNISLYPLRISDRTDGIAAEDAISRAILKAHVQNIPIVNLSYGGQGYNATTEIAMGMYDGLIVCAAGNGIETEGVGAEITETTPYYFPCYDADNVITVGSINHNKYLSSFSNYSNTYVDIMAYGESHVACTNTNGYASSVDGTSFASPVVAGVAALLLSYDNTLTTAQLKQYILNSVHETPELEEYCVTGGYLDAYGAFLKMIGERPISMNMQIQAVDYIESYTIEVNHHPSYSILTEIVVPQEVQNDIESISIEQTNDFITITLDLYLFVDAGNPLIELHFISYDSSAYVKGYTSIYSCEMIDTSDNIINQYPPSFKVITGDVNSDGLIDSSDMLKISRHISGIEALTGETLVAADVNSNFMIDSNDTVLLGEYMTNKIYSFY